MKQLWSVLRALFFALLAILCVIGVIVVLPAEGLTFWRKAYMIAVLVGMTVVLVICVAESLRRARKKNCEEEEEEDDG